MRRSCGRSRTRCICGASAGSRCGERVPDESTVRSSCGGSGPDVVDEITRAVIGEGGARAALRARAARIDSTVVEADVRYPTDAALALDAARVAGARGAPARGAGRRRGAAGARPFARDRQPAAAISRTIAARTGQAQASWCCAYRRGRRAARRLGPRGRRLAPGARARRAAAAPRPNARPPSGSSSSPTLAEKVCAQIEQRLRRRADHRPARLARPTRRAADPQGQARQADRVRLRRPARRGDAEHPPRRARLDPPRRPAGSARRTRTELLPADRQRARAARAAPARGRARRRLPPARPPSTLPDARRSSSPAATPPPPRTTNRRLASYRVGAEGRISHLKRRYGLRRSRLKGHPARAPGPAGRSSPTTSTRSPSAPPDTSPTAGPPPGSRNAPKRPRPTRGRCCSQPAAVYPGQVASSPAADQQAGPQSRSPGCDLGTGPSREAVA